MDDGIAGFGANATSLFNMVDSADVFKVTEFYYLATGEAVNGAQAMNKLRQDMINFILTGKVFIPDDYKRYSKDGHTENVSADSEETVNDSYQGLRLQR